MSDLLDRVSSVLSTLDHVQRELGRELAEKEGISINQLIAASLDGKMSALTTGEYLDERARRGSRKSLQRVLRKVKHRAPGGHAR